MTRAGAIAFLLSVAVCGCRTAENVASTSASVVTAPVHFVSKKLGGDQTSTETTETTAYENQPVETAPPPPQPVPARSPRPITSTTTTSSPPPQQNETHPSTSATSHPGTTPQSSSTNSAAQFPVAKPVPGKPGYVFSPYDSNGGYVDVSGYPSGSKVKDPYSQKIFLVP
jgi:type IV secretory pathway VirB10-like protein